ESSPTSDFLALPRVDQGLGRLSLRVMPREGPPVRKAVIREKPMIQEDPCRVRNAKIPIFAPRSHRTPECRHTRGCPELRRHIEEIRLRTTAAGRSPAS